MSVVGLGYVLLRSARCAEWAKLSEALGFSVEDDALRGAYRIRLDEWAVRMLVEPGPDESVQALGWQLADRRAFEDCVARVDAAGVTIREGTRAEAGHRGVTGVAFCTDPAGFPVELAYGPHVDPVNRLVNPGGVTFRTAGVGLGHVVLIVDCFDAQLDFYQRLLGLVTRDAMSAVIRGAFLGCNPRHHSLALLEGDEGSHLDHVMVEVDELDDVGRAYDRCLDGAAPVTSTLGRWGPDRMVSFYADTPSGFAVEVGTGGLSVDADWCERQLAVPAGSVWGHRRPA